MKKSIILLALLAGSATAAQAQSTIAKGTGLLGGNIGYSRNSEEYTSTFNNKTSTDTRTFDTFKTGLVAGGFVADNLALGLQVNHTATGGTATSTNYSPRDPARSSSLQVGPFVQYYKMMSEQFGATGTLGGGYESDFRQIDTGRNGYIDQTAKGYYASLTPGIVFFPIPKFGLTASIGSLSYNRLTIKTDGQPDTAEDVASSLNAGFGISQLQFGGTYYFGR